MRIRIGTGVDLDRMRIISNYGFGSDADYIGLRIPIVSGVDLDRKWTNIKR
jgi:hypothetical protein